jgi:hypothetical protein
MMYQCCDCDAVFSELDAAFIKDGVESYPYGDGNVYQDVGHDGCPQCLSDRLIDYQPPEEKEKDEQ